MKIEVRKKRPVDEPIVRVNKELPIIVTGHAVDRFLQRFKLIYSKELLSDRKSAHHFVHERFKESISIDFALRQCPGLYNAICVHYGGVARYNRSGPIIFVWEHIDNVRVVKTLLRNDTSIHYGFKF